MAENSVSGLSIQAFWLCACKWQVGVSKHKRPFMGAHTLRLMVVHNTLEFILGPPTHENCNYLEGQEDLLSRLITPISHIVTLIIPIINLVTKSP